MVFQIKKIIYDAYFDRKLKKYLHGLDKTDRDEVINILLVGMRFIGKKRSH